METKIKRLALKRIKFLIKNAISIYSNSPELAKRYIYIAWKIKQKANVKLPKSLKRSFCKKCFTPWIPGKTLRVRIRKGWIVYTCLNCGKIYKIKNIHSSDS